jgi:hypothetical protein
MASTAPEWPLSARPSPVWVSHSQTSRSWPALASVRPSGEKASCFTTPACPRSTRLPPDANVQMRTVASLPAEARSAPSGEKATNCIHPSWPLRTLPCVDLTSHTPSDLWPGPSR